MTFRGSMRSGCLAFLLGGRFARGRHGLFVIGLSLGGDEERLECRMCSVI